MAGFDVRARANSNTTRTYDEAVLRRCIRKVSLTGLELVRVSPTDAWVPLHTLPLFREEAKGGRAAEDTGALAHERSRAFGRFIGFMTIAGMLSVSTAIAAATGSQGGVLALGSLSMAAVGCGWVSGMVLAIRYGGDKRASNELLGTPQTDALGKSLAALEAAIAAAPADVRTSVDVADVREGVAAARRKRTLLAALHSSEDPRPGLLADLAIAKGRLARATDASAQDAFADEIRSIEGLLESMDRAARAAAESDARERALLHELDALRLAILAATTGSTAMNELTDHIASVRRQLQEEAAIERDLTSDLSGSAPRALGPQKA